MSFRLYDSAWVRIEGVEDPVQVRKDRQAPGVFIAAGHAYDIDARPLPASNAAPKLLAILSIQAVHEAGLRSGYGGRPD